MPEIIFDYDSIEEKVWIKIKKEFDNYNKLEQTKIKEETGIAKDYISNMLQKGESRQKISLPALILFAKALKKPIEYFIYEESIYLDFIKETYIKIPYIESYTDEQNNIVYKDKKYSCAVDYNSLPEDIKNPFKLVMLKIESDVMENTINKGDEIIIDPLQKIIHDGAIFAFNSYDFKNIRIRRFFIDTNKIRLICDNKERYDSSFTILKDINIIGKVIMSKHFLF